MPCGTLVAIGTTHFSEPQQLPDSSTIVYVGGPTLRGSSRAIGMYTVAGGVTTWTPAVDTSHVAIVAVSTGFAAAAPSTLALVRRPPWPDVTGHTSPVRRAPHRTTPRTCTLGFMRGGLWTTGMIAAAGILLGGCAQDDGTSSSSPTVSATAGTAARTATRTVEESTIVPTPTSPAPDCAVDLAAPAIQDAIATLAPYTPPNAPDTQWKWSTAPGTFQGNYDPCATLSAAIVTVEGATGSSPEHVLLFNRGHYVGTGTKEAGAFITLDAGHTTGDTVAVTYKSPGSCNACSDGTYTPVSFHWDGNSVRMTGEPPPLR